MPGWVPGNRAWLGRRPLDQPATREPLGGSEPAALTTPVALSLAERRRTPEFSGPPRRVRCIAMLAADLLEEVAEFFPDGLKAAPEVTAGEDRPPLHDREIT